MPGKNATPETPDANGGEVATSTNGTVDVQRVSLQFHEWLIRKAEDGEATRAFDVAASQLDKILSAETLDEIMNADMSGTYEGRDLVDFELEVKPGLRYVKSSDRFEAPLGVYVQFDATALMDKPEMGIVAGQDMIVSTQAPLVIGKLRTLEAGGFLPLQVRFIGVTAPNGTVLKIGKVPVRVVKA